MRLSLSRVGCLAFAVAFAGLNTRLLAEPGGDSDRAKSVTYSKEVARIIQNRCEACHRPGQIGPFSLTSYDDAKNWADTIKEVVTERRMPPWSADRSINKFKNDRSLTDEEIDTIKAWVAAGCPKGDDKDLPAPREYAEGWFIGKPDVVFTMPQEFSVPATGVLEYKHFVMPTDFDEDKWVSAVELKAGNPAVVHHILMSVRPPDWQPPGARPRDAVRQGNRVSSDEQALGFFAALAPGYIPPAFPPGFGKRIPKGSTIVFQMHYTPNGTAQTDRSSVGLVFAKQPVQNEIRTRGIFNSMFAIPPGADSYEVRSAFRFPQDSVVVSLMPHMHLRGKDFEYVAEYPDGRTEKVLSIPRWDFNWQGHYELTEPLVMTKGSLLRCTAHFDNSESNKANPDPTKRVTWGDQTWDEMMIGYIHYYVPAQKETTETAGGQ